MSKGLELLKAYENKYTFASQFNGDRLPYYQTIKMLEPIEKELKALEIIKNKSVNVRNLIIYCFEMNDTYEEYVDVFNYCDNYWELGNELLTEEEYNLLKEMLL